MKLLLPLLLLLSVSQVYASRAYPRSPDPRLTPGSLCESPSRYRYPEQVAYCDREDLNSFAKEAVFLAYRRLGFSLSGERNQYKVDHLIPLCAGGSNEENNLWPQYYTISALTDQLEPLGCEVLAKGKITQRELVDLIKRAKLDLTQVPRALAHLRRLNSR